MRFKILGSGTSTGVPVPGCHCHICLSKDPKNKRLRTSALIQSDLNDNILIDTSTDFRQQALTYGLSSVDAVLYTHSHADHVLGLDDLRGFNFVQGGPIPVYATADTLKDLKRIFSYVFQPDPGYQGGSAPEIEVHEIFEALPFEVGDLVIQPIPLLHGVTPVTGFRIGDLAYATDCKTISEASLRLLKGARYLFLDALRYEPHRTHLTIPEAIEIARRVGAEKTWFIHITHSVDYAEVSAKLPPGIELAYDGLEVEFNGRER